MGDWLGTGRIATHNMKFRTFKDARVHVHKLNLKSGVEWVNYTKSGKKPDDIPAGPESVYKDKGWKGMGDWIGTGRIANQDKKFRTFKDARAYVHKLNLKSVKEWKNYNRSGEKPDDIPANPNKTYKDQGWKGMGDWLGYT